MAAEAAKPNVYDIKKIDAYLDRMAGHEQECLEIMSAAMSECKTHREAMREIRSEAKDAGLRSAVFNQLWNARKAIENSRRKLADLEGDDLDQIEEILRHATDDKSFGDTPFGAHLISVFANA